MKSRGEVKNRFYSVAIAAIKLVPAMVPNKQERYTMKILFSLAIAGLVAAGSLGAIMNGLSKVLPLIGGN